MKAIALAKRLARDLVNPDLATMSADDRLVLVDAMNAGFQRYHALSPDNTKITTGALFLPGPKTVTLEVEQGSPVFSGYAAALEDLYCTVRVDGDGIDNQMVSDTELLHPYAGPSGTVNATIYGDASALFEPVIGLASNPRVLESGRLLLQDAAKTVEAKTMTQKPLREPWCWWTENNGRVSGPVAPSIFRVDSLPPSALRIQGTFYMGPLRLNITDLTDNDAAVLFREDTLESTLIPLIRGELAASPLWRLDATRADAIKRATEWVGITDIPQLSVPANRAGTPKGF
ncbi:MAG: hypothetical protein QM627_00015 [Luteolibacter sp.]